MPIRLSDIQDTEVPKKSIRLSDIPDEPKFNGQSPGVLSTLLNTSPERLEKEGKWVKSGLLKTGEDIYKEGVAPVLEGASTFAGGVPKMIAKAQGDEMTFPEQETFPGKLLRGASEVAGFTAGAPGRVAKFTGKALEKVAEKTIPKFAGKTLVSKIIQGTGAGSAGMATAGDTLDDRVSKAKAGAIIGGMTSGAGPIIKKSFDWIGKVGRTVSGIEKEVFDEASKKGFRNVLKSKYYNKKLPTEIQNRIADNIDNMQFEAGEEYKKLIEPLKNTAFDMPKLRGDVAKIANRIKTNPFDTESSKLDNAIYDGVINKANIKTLGDALDLRRNLDDIIYGNKGDLKSSFGKQVRDLLNKELHKNKELSAVDKEWASLQDVLKEGKKILGDTGEKILERFGNLTEKQKQTLVALEKKIGGLPFVEDLSNYSLAKEFITRKVSPSVSGIVRATSKPLLRGYLRTGESAEKFSGKAMQKINNLINKMQK
jgi:hypothetical protein